MKNNFISYQLKKVLKEKHGIELKNPEVETIEEIYSEFHFDLNINLLYKRTLNLIISFILILTVVLTNGTKFEKYISIICLIIYVVYNILLFVRRYKIFIQQNKEITKLKNEGV